MSLVRDVKNIHVKGAQKCQGKRTGVSKVEKFHPHHDDIPIEEIYPESPS